MVSRRIIPPITVISQNVRGRGQYDQKAEDNFEFNVLGLYNYLQDRWVRIAEETGKPISQVKDYTINYPWEENLDRAKVNRSKP